MSIGPQNQKIEDKEKNSVFNESLILLQELDRVKTERDDIKKQKEQMARDHLNQTLECNLDMKEENQMLKEQDIVRNDLLIRLEKKQEQMKTEVSNFNSY